MGLNFEWTKILKIYLQGIYIRMLINLHMKLHIYFLMDPVEILGIDGKGKKAM